jgi:hypothetical protein
VPIDTENNSTHPVVSIDDQQTNQSEDRVQALAEVHPKFRRICLLQHQFILYHTASTSEHSEHCCPFGRIQSLPVNYGAIPPPLSSFFRFDFLMTGCDPRVNFFLSTGLDRELKCVEERCAPGCLWSVRLARRVLLAYRPFWLPRGLWLQIYWMNFLNQRPRSSLEQLLQVLDLSQKKSDLLVTVFLEGLNDMLFEQDLTLNFFWVLKRDRRKKRLERRFLKETSAHVSSPLLPDCAVRTRTGSGVFKACARTCPPLAPGLADSPALPAASWCSGDFTFSVPCSCTSSVT